MHACMHANHACGNKWTSQTHDEWERHHARSGQHSAAFAAFSPGQPSAIRPCAIRQLQPRTRSTRSTRPPRSVFSRVCSRSTAAFSLASSSHTPPLSRVPRLLGRPMRRLNCPHLPQTQTWGWRSRAYSVPCNTIRGWVSLRVHSASVECGQHTVSRLCTDVPRGVLGSGLWFKLLVDCFCFAAVLVS